MEDRSIGGGLLDYDEFNPNAGEVARDDDDQLTVTSADPLRQRDGLGKLDPPIGEVIPAVPSVASVVCIPSSVPVPAASSSFLSQNRVNLWGEKTKLLSADHLGGRYLPSADREAFAKVHKLVADPLTRCPELDETVKDYAKMLHVSLDLRHDDILRDIGRRVADAWHPLLALHEVAE